MEPLESEKSIQDLIVNAFYNGIRMITIPLANINPLACMWGVAKIPKNEILTNWNRDRENIRIFPKKPEESSFGYVPKNSFEDWSFLFFELLKIDIEGAARLGAVDCRREIYSPEFLEYWGKKGSCKGFVMKYLNVPLPLKMAVYNTDAKVLILSFRYGI